MNIWEKQAQPFIAEYKTDLKEYGLPKDKIGWYIKNRYNQILKSFNEALKAQLKERDKDLKNLRKNAKDNEELSNFYKELQAKYEKDTAGLSPKLS